MFACDFEGQKIVWAFKTVESLILQDSHFTQRADMKNSKRTESRQKMSSSEEQAYLWSILPDLGKGS